MKGISPTTYVLNQVKTKFKLRKIISLSLNWLSCFLIFPCQLSSIKHNKTPKTLLTTPFTVAFSVHLNWFKESSAGLRQDSGVLSSPILGLPLEVNQTDPKPVQRRSPHVPDFGEGPLLRQEVYRSACRTRDTRWVLGLCLCLVFFHLVNMAV